MGKYREAYEAFTGGDRLPSKHRQALMPFLPLPKFVDPSEHEVKSLTAQLAGKVAEFKKLQRHSQAACDKERARCEKLLKEIDDLQKEQKKREEKAVDDFKKALQDEVKSEQAREDKQDASNDDAKSDEGGSDITLPGQASSL